MPTTPSPAQTGASRLNGARSAGPVTDSRKTRSALNRVRHGQSGRTFFLLADEDPAEFERHTAMWLAAWAPRDTHEHAAAEAAIRCLWREERADRLEALVLTDLFTAGRLPDPAEAEGAKTAAFKALNALLRYRARIEREHRTAMQALESLRQRRPARTAPRPSEPEPAPPAAPSRPAAVSVAAARVALRTEPEPRTLNRHQRRALAAIERQTLRRAA
jgi:hypothetical protein